MLNRQQFGSRCQSGKSSSNKNSTPTISWFILRKCKGEGGGGGNGVKKRGARGKRGNKTCRAKLNSWRVSKVAILSVAYNSSSPSFLLPLLFLPLSTLLSPSHSPLPIFFSFILRSKGRKLLISPHWINAAKVKWYIKVIVVENSAEKLPVLRKFPGILNSLSNRTC